jgi:hypothetical protein
MEVEVVNKDNFILSEAEIPLSRYWQPTFRSRDVLEPAAAVDP